MRLNNTHREKLTLLAISLLVFSVEQEAETQAHELLAESVRRDLARQLKPSELATLDRFEAVAYYEEVYIDGGEEAYGGFELNPRDVSVPAHNRPYRSRSRRRGNATEYAIKAPNTWQRQGRLKLPEYSSLTVARLRGYTEAVAAHDGVRREALRSIRSLIYKSTTLEAVIKVWPQAATIAEDLGLVRDLDKATVKAIKAAPMKPTA